MNDADPECAPAIFAPFFTDSKKRYFCDGPHLPLNSKKLTFEVIFPPISNFQTEKIPI